MPHVSKINDRSVISSSLYLYRSRTTVTGVSPDISADPRLFADVISYHVVAGNFSGQVATYPNVTVGRTYLSDPLVVALEGGLSQVLVWSRFNDSRIRILNQEYVCQPPSYQCIC